MPSRSEVVSEQLVTLGEDLRDLWVAITTDPKKQARKDRAWTVLTGALTVAGTMAARRGTAKLWSVLTGETPPIAPAPTSAPSGTGSGQQTDVQKGRPPAGAPA
jgi:hypothetical protein